MQEETCIRGKLSTLWDQHLPFSDRQPEDGVMYILFQILTYMYLISFIDIPNK